MHAFWISGVPKVTCEENDLTLDVVTTKPFRGNIFVKGRAKDTSCKQSYSTNSSNSYSLSLGKCGMQRLRSVSFFGVFFYQIRIQVKLIACKTLQIQKFKP